MKKYLITLLIAACFINFANANEINDEDIELNAFGYPDKNFVKLIENNQKSFSSFAIEKPDCSDKILVKKAQDATKPYIDQQASSIFNKRRNILITKNIDNFTDLDIKVAMDMDNRIIKARITELKINNKLNDQNFKICQSENPILDEKLFILMYDADDNIKAEILNLSVEENPSFYFYDK